MKKKILFISAGTIVALASFAYFEFAQSRYLFPEIMPQPSREVLGTPEGARLVFEDHQTDASFEGAPAPVDFSSRPEAETFFTAITEGAAEGPNFAGRYTVVTWGCGTSCQSSAIIDARTGEIVAYDIPSSYGLAYELWSSLLIVNPPDENVPDDALTPVETKYYLMRNGTLEETRP